MCCDANFFSTFECKDNFFFLIQKLIIFLVHHINLFPTVSRQYLIVLTYLSKFLLKRLCICYVPKDRLTVCLIARRIRLQLPTVHWQTSKPAMFSTLDQNPNTDKGLKKEQPGSLLKQLLSC